MSEQEPEQLTTVYLVNATRTSRGNGPGVLRLPPAEAAALLQNRLAVGGDKPPRGYDDGGAPAAQAAMMPRRAVGG